MDSGILWGDLACYNMNYFALPDLSKLRKKIGYKGQQVVESIGVGD